MPINCLMKKIIEKIIYFLKGQWYPQIIKKINWSQIRHNTYVPYPCMRVSGAGSMMAARRRRGLVLLLPSPYLPCALRCGHAPQVQWRRATGNWGFLQKSPLWQGLYKLVISSTEAQRIRLVVQKYSQLVLRYRVAHLVTECLLLTLPDSYALVWEVYVVHK